MSMTKVKSQEAYVYKITNKINGKCYVGKSINPHLRFARHFSTAKTGYSKNGKYQLIHKAIVKYGKENFICEIIEKCNSEKIAYNRENYWVEKLQSNNTRKYGYNLTNGGLGANALTDEQKQKISKALSGRINNFNGLLKRLYKLFCLVPGYKENHYKSKSALDKIAKTKKIKKDLSKKGFDLDDPNKKLTDDLKSEVLLLHKKYKRIITSEDIANLFNLRKAQILFILNKYKNGIPTEEQKHINRINGHKGKKHSEEHKRKISESNKGRIITKQTRQKISEKNSGINNGMYNKTHSKNTKNKLSKIQSTRKRKPLSEEHKEKLRIARAKRGKVQPISADLKEKIFKEYSGGNITKTALAKKYNIRYNSVCYIIRYPNGKPYKNK